MPTIKEVLAQTQTSEGISDSIKYRWISELDGKTYKYPDDADTELKYPFDIYEAYLIAMNDFFMGDLGAYQESSMKFYWRMSNI